VNGYRELGAKWEERKEQIRWGVQLKRDGWTPPRSPCAPGTFTYGPWLDGPCEDLRGYGGVHYNLILFHCRFTLRPHPNNVTFSIAGYLFIRNF